MSTVQKHKLNDYETRLVKLKEKKMNKESNFTDDNMMEIKNKVSIFIQNKRSEKNMSQAELAKQIGSTISTISRIERNVITPKTNLFLKIFLVLECSLIINDKVIL